MGYDKGIALLPMGNARTIASGPTIDRIALRNMEGHTNDEIGQHLIRTLSDPEQPS
jgi:hypothetical protein